MRNTPKPSISIWGKIALAITLMGLLAPTIASAQSSALPPTSTLIASPITPGGLLDPNSLDLSPSPSDGNMTINIGLPGEEAGKMAMGLQLIALLTLLTIAPALLMTLTSFTRIAVVLGFVRRALATQEVPPTQILLGLALFLTFFVMAPTWNRINEEALGPYFEEEITLQEGLTRAEVPIRDFLFKNTRVNDLALFVGVSGMDQPRTRDDVPTVILVPAFIISELQSAFLIGFIIYIPFLVIDMVIASILLSMGMMMLPPVIVSLPFKIILFVLVDGWSLVIGSLVRSFNI